jgi:cytochrome P450
MDHSILTAAARTFSPLPKLSLSGAVWKVLKDSRPVLPQEFAISMPTLTSPTVDEIPIYREGSTDEESARKLASDPLGFHLRAYREMGQVYRTMMGEKMTVIFSGLETNEFIWRNTDLWTYYDIFVAFREELGENHVTSIDGPDHRQKRLVLKPAFDQGPAMRYLPQYNAIFHEEMKRAPGSNEVEMVQFWAKALCKTNTKTVSQAEVADEVLDQIVAWEKALLGGLLMGDKRREYYGNPDYVALKATTMKLFGDIVDERIAHPDKYDDNFAMVMKARARDGADPASRETLIDDLYLVLLAGVENTSRLINTCLIFILRDPAWLAEIRAEIDPWDGQDIMALSRMSKLKATIMEAQRFYPLVMYNPRQATRDFEYGGFTIPAGTVILHVQVLCHFLEELYADPLSFRPQRFVEEGKFVGKANGFFGGGTHLCLGRNHTLLQTPIALAQMLKYYDFEPSAVAMNEKFISPGGSLKDLWAKVSPRKL